MSFQYPYIEHYSPAPASPLDTFATHPLSPWDAQSDSGNTCNGTQARLAAPTLYDQNTAVQQQCQITQQQESETTRPFMTAQTPTDTTPAPTYEPPRVIQLVERPRRRPRQQPAQSQSQTQTQAQNQSQAFSQLQDQAQVQQRSHTSSSLSAPSHSPIEQQQQQQQTSSTAPSPGQWFDLHELAKGKSDKNQRPATATARAQARLAAHPYRRSVSGPGSIGVNTNIKKQAQVSRNIVMAGGIIPSPTHQTPTSSLPASSPATDGPEQPRYLIRTDVHFSAATNTLTAMLELPGVKRSHLHLRLNVCPRSNSKQLVVHGRSQPLFSSSPADEKDKGKVEGYMVRERKFGEFKRVLVVPPETKPDHIKVSMEDGILFLRYPAGTQLQPDKNEPTPAN
ncbi:hypothetical protein M0805_008074 [Coniferiporia weirii]|nr:hypothetical protein M0805_008074 [Coniferiporia weirii]